MDYADLPKARAPRRGSTKPAAWPASAIASAVSSASTRPVRPQWPRPIVSPRLDGTPSLAGGEEGAAHLHR